ncbi:hypothetical protein KCV03_g10351, partial [Aureobasidium melanogenum]
MKFSTAIIAQVILLALTLSITLLRCFVHLRIEARALTLSDYLVWPGCTCTVAFVTCQGIALNAARTHQLVEATYTDSVVYLKAVYASCFFFDVGLFMPKLSITAFYWWLIPNVFRNMRYLLWITTFYVIAAALCSVFVDIFICFPVDYNWSLDYDKQGQSIWNSWTDFLINWGLNFSADVLLFFIPFFIIKSLQLRQRQKFGLIGVFSLGIITMAISFSRFMVYTVSNYDLDDTDGAVMCTAEMCTSLIVASLPGLKVLITRTVRTHTSRFTSSYNKSSEAPSQPSSRLAKISARLSHPRMNSAADSELELIMVNPSAKLHNGRLVTPALSVDLGGDQITVKHDFTVELGEDGERGSHHNTTSLPFV